MKPLLIFIVFAVLSPHIIFSQRNVSVASAPSWVTMKQPDFSNSSLDKKAEDGYMEVDIEKQVNLATQTEYSHRTKKILSEAGVQSTSQISVSFDPAYQHLVFHTLNIIRNGVKQNKLALSKIKTIHEEEDLRDYIYNDNLQALIILEDVRPGDIIDYSYSIVGFNPVMQNKYAEFFMTGLEVPVYNFYYKIIVPKERKLNIRALNEQSGPVITNRGDQQIFEWTKLNAEPVQQEEKTPSWYDPYPQIMVSEWSSWKDVNDWGLQLFPHPKQLSSNLSKAIKKIDEENASADKKVLAALRFVEDEVRYTGIESGEHSHRPSDPSKVFEQRFGDCKEKSYLLCTMLQSMHIDAVPVLINSDYKKTIATWLPAPVNFDHATVRVSLNNKVYYFDPTIPYQRGDLDNIFYPGYQVGLVLSDTTTSLANIPFKNTSSQEIKDVFTVSDMAGRGSLKVTTVSTGNDADYARSQFKENSYSELLNRYRKFYAYYYEDIVADSINAYDDDSTGTFTTVEFYTIPEFWKFDNGVKKFDVSPMSVAGLVTRSKDKRRNMPLNLPFPEHCKETVQVTLPEEWHVTESEQHMHKINFVFDQKFYCTDNKVFLESEYMNLKDHVMPDEATSYFRDLKTFDDNHDFEVTYTIGSRDTSKRTASSGISNIFISCAVIAGIVFFVVWSQRRS